MWIRRIIVAGLMFAGSACAREVPPSWDGPRLSQPRTQLTVEQLQTAETLDLLDMSFFAKPDWAEGEPHPFSGTASFAAAEMEMRLPQYREPYDGERLFPTFAADFIAHEGKLIPRRPGVIDTRAQSESYWDVILGDGAVWREAGDAGWSRASFPINLVGRYIGQVRNCVGMFAYNETAISNVYVQCSQETADLNAEQLADIRVMAPAIYEPKTWPDAAAFLEAHQRFVSRRIPVAPLSDIDKDGKIAEYFNRPIWTNAATTAGAIYLDGTLYLNPPMTRHGPYPYPDGMRLGVYSVTKSMAGALAMFHFAERYGEEIFDEEIADHVPALAGLPEWEGVTFFHALNMATGTPGGEEHHFLAEPLVLAPSAEAAIDNVAQFGAWPEAPGEKFNYASSDTFVLSYALRNYVEQKEGKGVHYWDLVHEGVLKPIGADDFRLLHTRDEDPDDRLPLLLAGAFPTLDNAAKIAALIANEGEHEGRQLLSRNRIREALGRTGWRGYPTGNFYSKRYRHSFWAKDVQARLLCRVEVPFMLGYGANYVLFLPSGAIVLRFMDEQDMNIDPLVRRVEAVTPSCK